ncbi:MAG: hypothetical protein AMJ46_06245 [Latescibacteria bacterium DG_63]|nr:MAG: hypothetical protein AMJ46_06245 [Latescibacteria bacterium DG_63]
MRKALAISLALLFGALSIASASGAGEIEKRAPMPGKPLAQTAAAYASDDSAGLHWGVNPLDVVSKLPTDRCPVAQDGLVANTVGQATELGPPFHIGGLPVYVAGPERQQTPDVAFDGTNYLVVWQDRRSGTGLEIYGTRVSPSGAVLDSSGFAVSINKTCTDPATAFDGANYLVVWADYRNGSTSDIYGTLVTISGQVLYPDGFAISTATNGQRDPDIAFDGTNYLVVWHDMRTESTWDIYGARVTTSGQVLDPDGILISAAHNDETDPSVAFGTSNYLVVWDDGRTGSHGIWGARVSPSGVVLDTAGVIISAGPYIQWDPSIAFDGTNYLVAWEDRRNNSTYPDIYATRVSASGVPIDTADFVISAGPLDQLDPSVTFDGLNYFVTWGDERDRRSIDVYGARVSMSGELLDVDGIQVVYAYGSQGFPAVASGDTNYLIVWNDGRGDSDAAYGGRVSLSGDALDIDGIPLSTVANPQRDPAIAFDGRNYLVAWSDYRGGVFVPEIYAARVSFSGELLDAEPIAIDSPPGAQLHPDAAFDGTNYFVVWETTDGNIYGARVDTSGHVLDPAGIPICTELHTQEDPAVDFGGSSYLVVWGDRRNVAVTGSDIYGARVDTSGNVLDPDGIDICTADDDQSYPDVSYNWQMDFLVVWEDDRNGGMGADIYGSRVRKTGVVVGGDGVGISMAVNHQFSPAVAYDGVNHLVVWEDRRHDGFSDIYGARVDVHFDILDDSGIPISLAPGRQYRPVVGFEGRHYVVVWEDERSGVRDIYGARVGLSGEVLDSQGTVISCASKNKFSPVVTRSKGYNLLIAYEAWTPPPYDSYRIWGNTWSGPTAVLFASASAASSGGSVTLSWEMGVDVPASSFAIQRSDSPEGKFAVVDIPVFEFGSLSYSCTDYSVIPGRTYWYKILLESSLGEETYGPIRVEVEPVPAVCRAHQSYPNPSSPFCTIRYEVPRPGRVLLRVFDVTGSLVRTLVDAHREPGSYSELWDGRADGGRQLPSGVYFYRLEAGDFLATRKMVQLR